MGWVLLPSGKFVNLSDLLFCGPGFSASGDVIVVKLIWSGGVAVDFKGEEAAYIFRAMQDKLKLTFTPPSTILVPRM